MNIITILRDYLGITQQELAKRANITQCDLCEMETKDPYGQIMKYQRVAKVLGVPVHALVTNNCTLVPESFFETHQHAEYLETTDRLGREGEECAWHMEQEKLEGIFPVLARLVIPYYKLRRYSPGYDILSFDEHGKPIFIEVKTTTYGEDKDFINRLRFHQYQIGYSPNVFGCHDREYRPMTHQKYLHTEYVYHLSEYANINHSLLKAFALGPLAVIKKAVKALCLGKITLCSNYLKIFCQLIGKSKHVYSCRQSHMKLQPNYLL